MGHHTVAGGLAGQGAQGSVNPDSSMGNGNPATWPAHGAWLSLTKLGPEDDVKAFLETFKRVAEVAQWPFILAPYLTGEAQAAVKALSNEDAADYTKSKSAILDCFIIIPKTHIQKF